jgi:hypothetical protein
MSSFIVFAFFAMFLFPAGQQVSAVRQHAHHSIDVIFGEELEHNTSELIFQ